MTSITIILLIAFGLVVLVAVRRRRAEVARQHRRMLGYARSGELLQLLRACQQHRGNQAALLGGQEGLQVRQRLQILRNEVSGGIVRLDGELRAASESADWAAFCSGWQGLQAELTGLTADASFERHSRLIALLLNLIWAEAEESGIMLDGNSHVRARCHQAFRQLPELAECLGQIRALAVASAASGQCAMASKVQLNYLLDRARKLCHLASLNQPQELLIRVSHQVVEASPVRAEAEVLFQEATGHIDSVFRTITQLLGGLSREHCGSQD